ncbi:hypothetical protein EXIGLDRAFT_143741 [Exidia glandulosa HHB12029]|uniref:Uncharacterized protein n=1 Tax=Exidia glandulosa HHB12029 TaxID=1314781 RepID=A0A165NBX7_EXIGL|nr:hypothetical protein EXIGLDRAFT_143741 [Exidia glandulosa HHB12029]
MLTTRACGRLTCSDATQLALDSRMTSTNDSACAVLMQDACRSSGPRRCGVPLSDGVRLPCCVLMLRRTFAGWSWSGVCLDSYREDEGHSAPMNGKLKESNPAAQEPSEPDHNAHVQRSTSRPGWEAGAQCGWHVYSDTEACTHRSGAVVQV